MKRSRFKEAQIIGILKQHEAGLGAKDLCRKNDVRGSRAIPRAEARHHKVGGAHLGAYAVHAAWLGDHRDESNGALADRLVGRALAAPVSRDWKGYWQRRAA